MNQNDTPLFTALENHYKKRPISLHVPGHKNGLLLKNDQFFQGILHIDATELTGLDDLHAPEGVIEEAERLLADAFHASKSFLLINGTTVGNLAMMMATLEEGDTVFIQRNCHKSILNALELTKARPVLLGPEYDPEWMVSGGVELETIREAFECYPECRAIVLTYPNYYGMTYELKEIIDFAHRYEIPVLVDEAHGAHFIGTEGFPPSAVALGADVVVQSAHKTLPAMTMGSFLHVNSQYISTEKIAHYLRMLQSSSPSYPIMASLDRARNYIATYTNRDAQYLKEQLASFKRELQTLEFIKVLEYPNQNGDPLKLTLQSNCGYTAYELQQLFEEKGIYAEMADPNNILFVLPLLKKDADFPFADIITKLKELRIQTARKRGRAHYFKKKRISTLYRVQSHKKVLFPIEDSAGFICAETIIPYPPGIPLLLSGEKITVEDVKGLQFLLQSGARFQGGENLEEGKITVFDKLEDNDD
ncbi:lysine decarboxylase [Robertmurraya siralis]|uniref:Lysine decarboxylase n=1 Tax=Robertmurraya siralis TaxID=77777 RepID=A0A920BWH9_9BACI|nr:aminotransferase class I/II-fold pyridoxal phosphate-dependent enzyme [Robertmurraya siralis]GIN64506.1 lysine decarboxylase [Robertmurraya siralis]